MFSHLSKRELLLHSVSSVLGVLLIASGISLHGQPAGAEGGVLGGTTASSTPGTTNTVTDTPSMSITVATYTAACGSGSIYVSYELVGAPSGTYYKVFREGLIVYEGIDRKFVDKGLTPGSRYSYMVYAFGSNQTVYGSGYNFGIAPALCQTQPTNPTSTTTSGSGTGTLGTSSPATTYPTTVTTQPVSGPQTGSPTIYTQPVTPTQTPTPQTQTPTATQETTNTVRPTTVEARPGANVERELQVTPPATVSGMPFSSSTEQKVMQLFTLVAVYDETDKIRAKSRDALVELIDRNLKESLATQGELSDTQRQELARKRAELIARISGHLDESIASNEEVSSAVSDIVSGIASLGTSISAEELQAKVNEAVVPLKTASDAEALAVKEKGGEQLFKDSNKDGISDYESVHVYNLDPVKPSPTSVYNGKKVTAGEKLALGFNPSKTELIPIIPEEPEKSPAPIASSYSVSSVELTADNKVALAGRALPNSYVTIFVYSTPVVVTVKTDANGVWKYTLSKELSDGSHKVSVATVDNSGRVLAKSEPIPFTKTAQAATIDSYSSGFIASSEHPSLFSMRTLYLIAMVLIGITLLTLGIMGLRPRKVESTEPAPVLPADVPR